MAIKGLFFNAIKTGDTYDRIYNAEDFCSYLNKLVSNGVLPTPASQLKVNASSGMNVIVGEGDAWIQGHKIVLDADLPLAIAAADVQYNRVDSVVVFVDYVNREMNIEVKQGTPGSNPQPQALVRDATRYEMRLAEIMVAKNTIEIKQANITDKRADNTVCGYTVGLIDQIDTTDLFNQFQVAFDEWFDDVKDAYSSQVLSRLEYVYTTTGSSEATFDVQSLIPSYNFSTDILMVYISDLYVPERDYTTSNATITLNTPVTHSGTEITFVVLKNAITGN